MPEVTIIFILINTIGTSLGFLVNLFLCYVALFHSPPIIRTYSVILINITLTNIGVCITGFLLQERIIQSGKSLFYVSYGYCSLFGERLCFDIFGAYLHFHTHALWLLFLSFAYRYYVMLQKEPKRKSLQAAIFIVYFPSFIQLSAMLFQKMDLDEVETALKDRFPQFNFTGLAVTGAIDIIGFATLYTLIHMTIISIPLAIGIQILRRKIINLLVLKGVDLTTKSRNLHAQLLRTLTFQATVPLIYFLDVFFFFLTHIWNNPILEFSIIIPSLIVPILIPISSLIYVTPYRNYVLRFFSLRPGLQAVNSQSIIPVIWI
ncbi:Serpentine Receptor, class D (Delta) [Caenorhabditis elegans]|uniref:Serpentine Receptor, class D (Delta) n=2 Tax=Caenorhabditis elegans TaxID=6239 RepID=A0A2C9C349_CAEEL|nr:Serpentine Receptor, class D (Delta) [Caenorhabditis elegans]SOF58796.1 Serpentine Receptor, class D (Delta) [Caenorhabditis elegans]|eukprot:NP_500839.2 Serpentine Receptor, class D (delta) [Caenorhabditis elegans]